MNIKGKQISNNTITESKLNLSKLTITSVTDNGTVLNIQGVNGQLFSIDDTLVGDLLTVSDISGMPILNVNSDENVDINGDLNLSGSLKNSTGNLTFTDIGGTYTLSQIVNSSTESTQRISTEEVTRSTADASLTSRISTEEVRRSNGLSTELSQRVSTDTILSNELSLTNQIAKGAQQALVYDDYQVLVGDLNGWDIDEINGNIGQNFYIKTIDVPDLWISGKIEPRVPYTFTSDQALIDAINSGGGSFKVGYFYLSFLETQKVNLTNYVTTTMLSTESSIRLSTDTILSTNITTHTHNYAGSSSAGGAATSALTTLNTVSGTNSAELVRGNMADNDQFRILVGATASNAGYAEIATADDGTEPIYVRQYGGPFTSLIRTLTLLDGSGNTSIPGNLSVTGTLSASDYNKTNWDNAYSQRLQWDGGSTNLVAATGRTSLGLGGAATLNVGTASGTVAAGDHNHSGVYLPVGGKAADTDLFDGTDSANFIYGNKISGASGAEVTWSSADKTQWHSGFWDIFDASWTPTTDWYWGITASHQTNTASYNYSAQYITNINGTEMYFRTIENSTPNTWRRVWHEGNDGAASGMYAQYANQLGTARNINGTSFDGTGNITTASWGTARTITIGSTGKSVDGSGNVSWSLAEIGAAASSHTHNYAGSSSAGGAANSVANSFILKFDTGTTENTNLYTFNGSADKTIDIKAGTNVTLTKAANTVTISATNTNTTYTFGSGTTNGAFSVTPSDGSAQTVSIYGLGTAAYTASTAYAASGHTHNYAGSASAGGAANSVANSYVIKFDTGTTENTDLYTFNGSGGKTIDIKAGTNVTLTKAANTITISANDTSVDYSQLTGTVPTWNQNTTGSAETLTTARTLTIGSTGKTFNGGADVSWSLAEIGAQAAGNYQPLDADLTAIAALAGTTGLLKKTAADTWTLDTNTYALNNQTMYIGTTSVTINRSIGALSLTGVSIDGNAGTVTNGLYTTTSFGGDVSGTYNAIVVADNSHNHTSSNISDATNANTANMIVKRDGSGNFSAGTITANGITIANPGVGTGAGFIFSKTSDTAGINVIEHSSDLTLYEFYMTDNPDGGDYFSWRFGDWQGSGGQWVPLYLGGMENMLTAKTTRIYGDINQYTSGFFTTSNIGATNSTEPVINNLSKLKTTGTGTITITTLDINGYTGINGDVFFIKLTGTGTTFDWGYGWVSSTPVQTGLTVSTSNTTLSNGIVVAFSAAVGGVAGDVYQCRVWKPSRADFGTVGANKFQVSNAIYFGGGNNYLNWTNSRIYSNMGIEGSSFVKTGGTSSQFLKADGTVDSSAYITSSGVNFTNLSANGSVGTGSNQVAVGNHTHSYAGSSSAGGAANSVANSFTIKFDTGATENTSLYTFNGSAAKTIDIKGGTNVTLTETANTVTISATDTNTTYTFATGTTNGAFSVTPSGGSAQSVSIYGLGSAAYTNSNAYAATNQTMYIGTTAVTINRASGALSLTGVSIDGNAGTVTNGVYTSGSYSDPSWLTISKSKVGLGNVENTALSTWGGSANITTIGAATATSLSVTGNLIVNGTTTTVHSTTVTLDDPILTLGGDTAPTVDDNKDRGIEFRWHDGTSGKTGFFGFDDSTGYFTFIPDATNTSEVFSGTQGDIQASNFRGTLIGSISNAITFNTTGGAAAGTTYNGSAARTIDYSTVGAASAGHTHNYAGSASAGGAATSALTVVNTVSGTNSAELVRGNMADNDQFRILVGGTGSNAGYAEIATADDGTEPIYVRQYTGVFTSLTRTLTLLDGSGNTSIPGNLSVTGTLSASGYNNTNWDNAYSQRLQWDGGSTNLVAATGRTSLGATTVGSNLFTLANPSAITFIRINADNTVSTLDAATFRTAIGAGTGNGTVTSVGATSPVASSGGNAPTISLNAAYGDTLNPYGSKTANYFLAAPNGTAGAPTFRAIVAADIPTLDQNTTGSAAKWTTARTVTFATGDVTGSFSIDGSANVGNVDLQVVDDSHNHSSSSGNFQVGGDLYAVGGNLYTNSGDSRTKIGFWGNGDTTYGIGMGSAYTFGGLNDYALTFQMSNTDARGFWFGDSTHTNAQGAMALTTTGLLTVASGLRIGYGESDSGDPVANVVDVSGALKVNTGTQSSKTSANSPVTLYTLAVSGTTNTCMIADYTVVNTGGTAQRSGTVTCNFNASNVTYTSTATPDLGTSTAAVTIAPVISSGSVLLRATITGADTWNIKVSVRYF